MLKCPVVNIGANRATSAKEEKHSSIKRKRDLKQVLGYRFSSNIHLDGLAILPNGVIKGSLIIVNDAEKEHQGIRIQLEGVMTLKASSSEYLSSGESRTEVANIIPGVFDVGLKSECSFSPLGVQILGTPFDDSESELSSHILPKGTTVYPFTFQMTGEPLPTPFKRKGRSLEYQLAAYMRDSIYFVKIAKLAVPFKGHHSLYSDPPISRPIMHESQIEVKTSMFSSAIFIKATMTGDESDFLPDEEIQFQLSVSSTKEFSVESAIVNLIRKTTYSINGANKMGQNILDTFEAYEIMNDEGSSWFVGFLRVPRNCIPSYKESDSYNVIHFLEYEVKVAEHHTPVKGQVDVIIGTTRDDAETLLSKEMAALQIDSVDNIESQPLGRSLSMESRLSECSLLTLPSNYCQLSGRASSMLALDKLPPL